MAKHYQIIIDVAYDEATVPAKHIVSDLDIRVHQAIRGGLLSDLLSESVVEEYRVEVREK